MTTDQSPGDSGQQKAEKAITDLMRRMIEAAKDGRAHMSHEEQSLCLGCKAVREAMNFVHLMTSED